MDSKINIILHFNNYLNLMMQVFVWLFNLYILLLVHTK